jgi:hypothetical protein
MATIRPAWPFQAELTRTTDPGPGNAMDLRDRADAARGTGRDCEVVVHFADCVIGHANFSYLAA